MQLKDFNLEDFKKGAKCVYELVERCFEGTRTTYVPVFYYGEIDNVNAPIVVRCIGAKGYEYVAQTNDDGYLNTGDVELDFQLKLVEPEHIPFTTEAYQPTDRVVTVEGLPVEIFTTHANGDLPVVGQVADIDNIYRWSSNGKQGPNSDNDLVIVR